MYSSLESMMLKIISNGPKREGNGGMKRNGGRIPKPVSCPVRDVSLFFSKGFELLLELEETHFN